MPHRYFSKEFAHGMAWLSEADSRHLCVVMRAQAGQAVTVCDGHGTDYACRLAVVSPARAGLDILSSEKSVSEPSVRVILYVGYPKQDKLEHVIQKATELGAARIVPFFSRFCVAAPKNEEKKHERYARIAFEAAKQAGRGAVPEVGLPLTYKQMLAEAAGADTALFCYEKGGAPLHSRLAGGNTIAIVTGSALGLGYELASQLIANGWLVAGVDFNAERQAELTVQWPDDSYRAYVGDITDEAFVKESVADIATLGHIDLLINNAGQPSFKVPTAYEAADVDKCLKGLKGMILWTVETLKACGEQNVKIAQIMSTAATRGNANESVYCATKWGEKGYTKSLQAAYKGTSVKVVAVYPGGIDTAFYRDSRDYVSEAKQHTFMQPGPLAEVILFNLINEANLTVTDIEINRNS